MVARDNKNWMVAKMNMCYYIAIFNSYCEI